MSAAKNGRIRVASLEDLRKKKVVVVHGKDRPIAVFAHDGGVAAVDNRCPHLGFPLSRGQVKDGLLTCPWHHARFDLCSGCTFDLWADDTPVFETSVEGGEVFVSATPRDEPDASYHFKRLRRGMEQRIGLIQAKSVIGLLHTGATKEQIIREAALYGSRNQDGFGGQVSLAIAGRLFGMLRDETNYFALVRGVQEVAQASTAVRRPREALDGEGHTLEQLKRWWRHWCQARHRDGAERVLLTVIAMGASPAQVSDLMFSGVSDRVYSAQGHTFDFVNKGFELCELIGWTHAAEILPLLVPAIAGARGAEEDAKWHHPEEVVTPLRALERDLPEILMRGSKHGWDDDGTLTDTLLGEDPHKILRTLREALEAGAEPLALSKRVAYAAALRLARFPKSNEVGDWFDPQHTYNFAHAVHQAIRRSPTPDVIRALFHAALAVYHDRYLNVPPAKLPGEEVEKLPSDPQELRTLLLDTLDHRSELDTACRIVARYERLGHRHEDLVDTLAYATVREDLDFHTWQVLEDGVMQYREWKGRPEAEHILVGITRQLAAVCPTPRARLQTATIALRLHRGDKMYENGE